MVKKSLKKILLEKMHVGKVQPFQGIQPQQGDQPHKKFQPQQGVQLHQGVLPY